MADEVREYVIVVTSDGRSCFPLTRTPAERVTGHCREMRRALCTFREAMELARECEKELGLPGDARFREGASRPAAAADPEPAKKPGRKRRK